MCPEQDRWTLERLLTQGVCVSSVGSDHIKDVPGLRINHISIESKLLGVRQLPYGSECDPIVVEIERRLSPHSARALIVRNQKHER
jgi:hypothetical protein